MILLSTILCVLACAAGPPRPVHYTWREAGEYPFSATDPNTLKYREYTEYREAGLRIAQPSGRTLPLSSGDIRTPEQWLQTVVKHWLKDDSDHVLDGNLWRDGVVNMTDFAVVSRWWRYEERDIDKAVRLAEAWIEE